MSRMALIILILCCPLCGWTADIGASGQDTRIGHPIPELSLLLGWNQFTTDDIDDTYGGLLSCGLRFCWTTSDRSEFFLAAQYGAVSGDPYYDVPTFEGFEAAHLRALPLQMGVRWNTTEQTRIRVYFGLAIEAVWAEEETPAISESRRDNMQADSGWVYGFRISLGPEWRSRDENRAVGLEIGYDECGGDIGKGRHRHDLNLSAFGARAYYAIQL
jgi:hypothetical protein